jgi:hypothetical protein
VILKIQPDSRGNLSIKLGINIWDVWWIGVVIPHHEEVEISLECGEVECGVTSLKRMD